MRRRRQVRRGGRGRRARRRSARRRKARGRPVRRNWRAFPALRFVGRSGSRAELGVPSRHSFGTVSTNDWRSESFANARARLAWLFFQSILGYRKSGPPRETPTTTKTGLEPFPP